MGTLSQERARVLELFYSEGPTVAYYLARIELNRLERDERGGLLPLPQAIEKLMKTVEARRFGVCRQCRQEFFADHLERRGGVCAGCRAGTPLREDAVAAAPRQDAVAAHFKPDFRTRAAGPEEELPF